jgi:hypothetical protein
MLSNTSSMCPRSISGDIASFVGVRKAASFVASMSPVGGQTAAARGCMPTQPVITTTAIAVAVSTGEGIQAKAPAGARESPSWCWGESAVEERELSGRTKKLRRGEVTADGATGRERGTASSTQLAGTCRDQLDWKGK